MKKSNKFAWLAGIMAAMTVLLAGCGGKTAEQPELNPTEAVASLQSSAVLTDELVTKDLEGTLAFYGIDPELVTDAAAAVGSGATVEMISVWKAKTEADAQQLQTDLNGFNDLWKEGYGDYKPEEVPKLDSAVLEQQGLYVIYCVTADNNAAADAAGKLLGK